MTAPNVVSVGLLSVVTTSNMCCDRWCAACGDGVLHLVMVCYVVCYAVWYAVLCVVDILCGDSQLKCNKIQHGMIGVI